MEGKAVTLSASYLSLLKRCWHNGLHQLPHNPTPVIMTICTPSFDIPSSLQEYAISEKEYIDQHEGVHIICTGAVVFNKEGKLLLVQRAKDEKAFPDAWVNWSSFVTSNTALTSDRKSLEGRWMRQTRQYCMPLHAS